MKDKLMEMIIPTHNIYFRAIPVAERLPDACGTYFVMTKNRNGCIWFDGTNFAVTDITHWLERVSVDLRISPLT